jgi:DNA replication and repair protein RecF
VVRHALKDMPAELSSTGEQKALLIGLVLAQAALVADMTGIAPILLLDEAVAHLDARRRAALFERLSGLGGQVWLTGTDTALFEGAAADKVLITINQGRVHA